MFLLFCHPFASRIIIVSVQSANLKFLPRISPEIFKSWRKTRWVPTNFFREPDAKQKYRTYDFHRYVTRVVTLHFAKAKVNPANFAIAYVWVGMSSGFSRVFTCVYAFVKAPTYARPCIYECAFTYRRGRGSWMCDSGWTFVGTHTYANK